MLGEKLGGRRYEPERAWVEVESSFIDLLPAYPGASVIAVARVPEPPVVTEAMGKPKALRLTALGYRAAVENAYGEPPRILIEAMRKDYKAILESKHAPALVQALPLMMDHKIAPASWTAFSIMVWKNYVMAGSGPAWDSVPSRVRRPKRGTPPPPSWVFSLKRLDNRTDWFGWHEAHCRGGKLKISKPHKTLIDRYEALRCALLQEPKLTRSRVSELVAEHLPASEYQRLAQKAKADADFEQDKMAAAIESGEWIW